jgi:hypothetical protein
MSVPYVTGALQPEQPFHIVSKITVSDSNQSLFDDTEAPVTGDTYWSFLGIREEYTNFGDVYDKPFYYRTGNTWHYPLYLESTGRTALSIFSGETQTFYRDTSDTAAATGYTTKPHADLRLLSYNSLKNVKYYVQGTNDATSNYGFHANVFLNTARGTNEHTFDEFGDIIFYTDDTLAAVNITPNGTSDNAGVPTFYNQFNSLMNAKFKYSLVDGGSAKTFTLVSSGRYTETADQYKYLNFDSETKNIKASKSSVYASNFVMKITDSTLNLPGTVLYAGVPYNFTAIGDGTSYFNFNYETGIEKPGTTVISDYITDTTTLKTPAIENFIGASSDFTNNYHQQPFPTSTISTTMEFYFIPISEMSYSLANSEIMTYTGYNAQEMMIMSPYVFNVEPLIVDGESLPSPGANSVYYSWVNSYSQVLGNKLGFSTTYVGSSDGLPLKYCTDTDTCGACFGKCPTLGEGCIYDTTTQSASVPYTCDSEKYLSVSDRGTHTLNHTLMYTLIGVASFFFISAIVIEIVNVKNMKKKIIHI